MRCNRFLVFGFWLVVFSVAAGAVPTAASAPGEDWRYRDVVDLIEERAALGRPFRSPDELIAALPVGLRRNFTFVFDTGNKFQAASPLHPRAIVFGKFLVYAFNGHPSQKGYDTLELMELDPGKRRIELREISFHEEKGIRKIRVGTSTPEKCLQCHGANPRPIWTMYSKWPGVYGTSNDFLDGKLDEESHYRKFLAAVRRDPESRYAKLVFPKGSPLTPYMDGTPQTVSYGFRPNLVLTKVLTRFNAIRLVGLAQESPYYPAYRWVLPLALAENGCHLDDNMRGRLERHLNTIALAQGEPNLDTDELRGPLLNLLGVTATRYNMDPTAKGYYYVDGTGEQRAIFGDALIHELARENTGLASLLDPTRDQHGERYGVYPLYKLLDELVPKLGSVGNKACAVLKQLAERQLAADPVIPKSLGKARSFAARLRIAEENRVSTAVPVSCVFCHNTGRSGPEIPFDDRIALRRDLTADGGRLLRQMRERSRPEAPDHRRMPPASSHEFAPLSAKEFEAFNGFLKDLTGL